MPPETIPGEDVWRQCADFDRAKEQEQAAATAVRVPDGQ
jgi:hypothetical protein